jgi:hypothetical protein
MSGCGATFGLDGGASVLEDHEPEALGLSLPVRKAMRYAGELGDIRADNRPVFLEAVLQLLPRHRERQVADVDLGALALGRLGASGVAFAACR